MNADENLDVSANFDLRLETLAATLLERSTDFTIEQVIVAPKGNHDRRSGKDVKRLRKKHYLHDTVLYLEANRKGLFDTLPPGLFLDIDPEKADTGKKVARVVKEQTAAARKFFLPFEQAMYLPRIEAEQLEQRWTQTFPPFIERLWGLTEYEKVLDERQRFLLCYLLPEAYRVVGDWQLTGLCFEAVLRKPVDLNFIAPLTYTTSNSKKAEEERLGTDYVLGDTFTDDMPALRVTVRGVTYHELSEYLIDGGQRRVIEDLLYAYFLPLEVTVITEINVTDDAWTGEFGRATLGYNFRLN